MIRLNQIIMPIEHSDEALIQKCYKTLQVSKDDVLFFQIVKRSIDARKKPDLIYSYSVDVACKNEDKVLKKCKYKYAEKSSTVLYKFPTLTDSHSDKKIIVVGMGPAGLFCAYMLAKHGFKPIVLERGDDVCTRQKKVQEFWETGRLDTHSNVQFGEGGAGTFSDGKLNTLIKDPCGRNKEVLSILVEHGAPDKILYDAKPHIGTDVLSQVVKNMREHIIAYGGEVHFNTQMTAITYENHKVTGVDVSSGEHFDADDVVLALGHSARDTFEYLYELGIPMSAKPFAVGFRVQHPQKLINLAQYGVCQHDALGAAAYKITAKTSFNRGVYSFCMCPGGYVVNASSEEGRLVVNGMSYSGRDSACANSAIIVSVTPNDYESDHPLAGVWFQRKMEEKAYALCNGKIPVQSYGAFKYAVTGKEAKETFAPGIPCIKGMYDHADLTGVLPDELNKAFVEGMEHFDKIIPGFASRNALMCGVESRTSSPLRIERDNSMQSSIRGVYPCGEGAGYAGGITSAAMDGMRVAEEIAIKYSQKE